MENERGWRSLHFLISFTLWIILLLEDSVTGICDDANHILDSTCFEVMAGSGNRLTYQQADQICQESVTTASGMNYKGQGLAVLSTPDVERIGLFVLAEARENILISDNDYIWLGAHEDTGQPKWTWVKDEKMLSHQGCFFYEDKPSTLPKPIIVDDILPEKCIQVCKSSPYVAVKNPDRCYCLQDLSSFRADRRSLCTSCSGSPDFSIFQTCGAYSTSHYDIFYIDGTYGKWASSQPDNHDIDAYCASLAYDDFYKDQLVDSRCIEDLFPSICDIFLAPDECSTRSRPYFYSVETSSCIYVDTANRNWYEAREKCVERNGDLVTIESIEKNAFILSSLSSSTQRPRNIWVGLSATGWSWNSGTPFIYTNWEENLIYSKGTNCLAAKWAVHLFRFWWTVQPCDTQHFFLCNYNSASSTLGPTTTEVPTTSAMTTTSTTQAPTTTAKDTTIALTTEPSTTVETTFRETTNLSASDVTADNAFSVNTSASSTNNVTDATAQIDPHEDAYKSSVSYPAVTIASNRPPWDRNPVTKVLSGGGSNAGSSKESQIAGESEASTSADQSGIKGNGEGTNGSPAAGGSTNDGGLSTLEIVLIIMVVIILVLLFIVLLVFLLMKKKEKSRTQVGPEPYDARGKAIYPNSEPIFVPPGGSTLTNESSSAYNLPPRKKGNLDPKEKIYIT